MLRRALLFIMFLSLFVSCQHEEQVTDHKMVHHHSKSEERIHKDNVHRLDLAWEHHNKELEIYAGLQQSKMMHSKVNFSATPILVHDTLYFSTPSNRVFALNPATGQELWSYDPKISNGANLFFTELDSRGVTVWENKDLTLLYLGTVDGRLIALNASTGLPYEGFAKNGMIDLTLGSGPASGGVAKAGYYQVITPPTVLGDTIIVGSAMADNRIATEARGIVRCYSALTGKLIWDWDPIPRNEGEEGYETWSGDKDSHRLGAANTSSSIIADPERDLVFLATNSASPNHFGGPRHGDNLFANSLVALKASTGEKVWHKQIVRHDVWDSDFVSPAILMDIDGVPAISIMSPNGYLYVLHRDTGTSLFSTIEMEVPHSQVPGEKCSPIQVVPVKPQILGLADPKPWGVDEEERQFAENWISQLTFEGAFTPPSLQGSIASPSHVNGLFWGGMAYDAKLSLLITPVNRIASVITLIPRKDLVSHQQFSGKQIDGMLGQQKQTPYGVMREFLISKKHEGIVPLTPPPWGTLNAIDLSTGETVWEIPLGHALDPSIYPHAKEWGSITEGGVLLTDEQLTFIAATLDATFRAFDTATGKVLWEKKLPAPAFSTPMTYVYQGEQYVVIAAGGDGRLNTELSDSLLAYKLRKGFDN